MSPKAPISKVPPVPEFGFVDSVLEEESPLNLDLQHLSASVAESISALVSQFRKVFTSNMGLTHLLEYEISLKDKEPSRLPPYRLSPPKMNILRGHINLMLEKGIIRPSIPPYSSPIF